MIRKKIVFGNSDVTPISPSSLCISKCWNQTTPEIQEVTCTRRTIMCFFHEVASDIYGLSACGWNYRWFTSGHYTYAKTIILILSIWWILLFIGSIICLREYIVEQYKTDVSYTSYINYLFCLFYFIISINTRKYIVYLNRKIAKQVKTL